MENSLDTLYHLPDIEQYEDVHLLTLRDNCTMLEEKVRLILDTMPLEHQQTIEAYIDMRDELELQSVKAALRWGKKYHK